MVMTRLAQVWDKLQFLIKITSGVMMGWAAFLISHVETGKTVISHERGDRSPEQLGARVAIFCHFDKFGQIRDHIRHYVNALRAEGFEIVFVTNSRSLAPPDLTWAREHAACLVFRRNIGYDFAAWRDAMEVCGLPTADTQFLLVANDSVYGPLRPLAPALRRINFDQADVWSATDSWQHRFHLQSYFVAFGPNALRHVAFGSFWKSVANVRSKWWVVRHYELSMSRVLTAAGLRCRALWPYMEMIEVLREEAARGETRDIKAKVVDFGVTEASRRNAARVLSMALRRTPLNPTADLWQVLIEQGCPFLKRELLNRNPSKVMDVAAWYSLIGRLDIVRRELILRDLEQTLKGRSP